MLESDIVRKVQQRLDLSYLHDRDNRLDAAQDLRFLAGDQWPANVRAEREQQNRPVLTLNRLPQYVNQVVNDFKQSPPAIKCVPADEDPDSDLMDAYNGIFSEIQYQSNSINVFGTAFAHSVSCGMGHFRITTDYVSEDSFDQQILIKRIPYPLSVFWDPDAVEPHRGDSKWCVVSEMMTEAAFKETYPDVPINSIHIPIDEQFGVSRLYWRLNDLVRIAEYWEKVPVTKKLVLLENGETLDATELKAEHLAFLPKIKREREVEGWEIRQWLVSGAGVLDGGIEGNKWAGSFIPIVSVIGSEIPLEDKLIRHGLIRFARDPQQLYNYWQSAATEAIALQPKAPFLATPRMIAKFKGQWDTQNTVTRPYLLYEPDPEVPGGRPQREPPPAVPSAMLQQSQVAVEDMKAITGIYDASMGRRSNETSGRAIVARAHQGDVGSYQYLDNFNASLIQTGRIINDLIPKIYDGERAIRLPHEEHEEPKFAKVNQVQLAADGTPLVKNDLSQGRFDVRVKIGPSFATRRMEAVDSLMKFIQAFPQAAAVSGDLIINLLDIPKAEELAERLKRMIPPQVLGEDKEMTPEQQQAAQAAQQQQAQQQQMQQMAAQLEMALKQAQTQKLGADAEQSQATTRLKNADADMREAQAQIAKIHAFLQAHGVNVNQPENGFPSLNGVESASQGPSQHQQNHADYQSSLDSMTKEEKLRQTSAAADQAEARTQSAILDAQIKRQKLGQENYSGY
jgi:hypothetical protein